MGTHPANHGEGVGTHRHAEQKENQWFKPLLAGEMRSAFAMDRAPTLASSDAKNSLYPLLVLEKTGAKWFINGGEMTISRRAGGSAAVRS